MFWPVPALVAVVSLLVSLAVLPFRIWWLAVVAALSAPIAVVTMMGGMAAYYYGNELIFWFNKRFLGLPRPGERPPLPWERQDDNEKKEK